MRSPVNYLLSIAYLFLFSHLAISTNYYVNNSSLAADIYCTAIGNNSNNGLNPSMPKATLSNLLSTYSGVLTAGDVIKIDAGTYNDKNLNLNIAGISIIGAGPALTRFDNNWASADGNRLFNITANNITVQGIYVTGYNYGVGGASAIQISGATGIVFNNVLTDENHPGGGSSTIVINSGSIVTFNGGGSNCNSSSSVAGGGVNVEGNGNNVTFNNYSFSNNSKDFQGGSGLYIVGDNTTNVTVNNSIFADNRNTSDGGAIYISGSNLAVNGSCFSNNSTYSGSGPKYGGAVTVGRGATVSFANCTFTNNSVSNSGNGGVVAINTSYGGSGSAATVNLNTCTFTGNLSDNSGHHLYARVGSGHAATINVNNCTFSASGQDIKNGNTATINVQNSGNPSSSGTVNYINTLAPASVASTNCPALQGSCYGVVLPIELMDFDGACEMTHTHLWWSTATEHNNDHFTIERAGNDGAFYTLAIVNGKMNTTQRTDYSFADYYAEPGVNYYRLSQTDVDGMERILKTISVENNCLSGNGLDISCWYDGQNNAVEIGYLFELRQIVDAQIVNMMGQVVATTQLVLDPHERTAQMKLNETFSNGMYFLRLSNNSIQYSEKFMIGK